MPERSIVELASFAEPVMQRRYGAATAVEVLECTCPASEADKQPFEQHALKVRVLLARFEQLNAPRSKSKPYLWLRSPSCPSEF